MKISTPLRYFAEKNNSEILKNSILMARGDVICQYSIVNNPINDSDWIDFNSITNNIEDYKWMRISFDNGKTFPFKSKLNSEVIKEFNFEINDTNIIANTEPGDSTFIQRYSYPIEDVNEYTAIKNNPVAVFVDCR